MLAGKQKAKSPTKKAFKEDTAQISLFSGKVVQQQTALSQLDQNTALFRGEAASRERITPRK